MTAEGEINIGEIWAIYGREKMNKKFMKIIEKNCMKQRPQNIFMTFQNYQ